MQTRQDNASNTQYSFGLTSNQHRDDAEYFLCTGGGRHVAEPDAGQTGTSEIQRSYVRLRVRHVVHVLMQTFGQCVHPPYAITDLQDAVN